MQINKIGQRATKYYFARFKHQYYWKGYVERAEMNFKIEFLFWTWSFHFSKMKTSCKIQNTHGVYYFRIHFQECKSVLLPLQM